MNLPEGVTEQQFVDTVDKIVRTLAPLFKFGYYDIKDIKQEGRLFAIQALPRFDPSRGSLYSFLRTHIRNRLINLKRDKFLRVPPPCYTCNYYNESASTCQLHSMRKACEKWCAWESTTEVKKNLVEAACDSSGPVGVDHDVLSQIAKREILDIIDDNLPNDLRKDYIAYLSGSRLPNKKYEQLYDTITSILRERGIINGEETTDEGAIAP